jgi:hypothetical protein
MFGGSMTIDEFRQGFMIIENIEWVARCFTSTQEYTNQLGVYAKLRPYVYDFLPTRHDCLPLQSREKDAQEYVEEKTQEPEVMIGGIDESYFY